jgi:uncharacterized RDD family membrane protein YckC
VLVAGSGPDLWVAHPILLERKGTHTPAFEMLHRAGNSGVWTLAVNMRGSTGGGGGETSWYSFPEGLAVLPQKVKPSPGFVMNDGGTVSAFLPTRKFIEENLPNSHVVKAATGSSAGIFVLTEGVPLPSMTRPGQRITEDTQYYRSPMELVQRGEAGTEPASAPATTTAPATATATTTMATTAPGGPELAAGAASAPATTTRSVASSAPATTRGASAFFNTYWYQEDHWHYLPSLGERSAGNPGAPGSASFTALGVAGDYLLAMWIDPAQPGELVVRSLEYRKEDAAWSAPVVSAIGAGSLPTSRLMTANVDNLLYVFWSVPTGGSIELQGGRIDTRPGSATWLKLPAENRMRAVDLGAAGAGISPATDVAVGASENTLLAVVNSKAGKLVSVTFDTRGNPLGGATEIEATVFRPDLQIGQNLTLLVLILTSALFLWQSRQKPMVLALPTGMIAAPLHLRLAAGLVDLTIPYVLVLAIFNRWEEATTLFPAWVSGLSHPDELAHSSIFMVFLGLYLLHVTVGELLFRRTAGKALVGLQVLMIDGRAPTLAAILLRNLLRFPDLLVGIVVLALSDHHQRIGDYLARTLVVSQKPPETPEDPDADAT